MRGVCIVSGVASSEAMYRVASTRHRDDPPPMLRTELPVDRLLDSEYSRQLASDIRAAADGADWECLSATKSAARRIPAKSGLYAFVWNPSGIALSLQTGPRPSTILYVGSAGGDAGKGTLKSRYVGEYSKYVGGDPEVLWTSTEAKTRKERLRRYLCVFPLEYWFLVLKPGTDIFDLETKLINLWGPPLNQAVGPRLRVARATPAF